MFGRKTATHMAETRASTPAWSKYERISLREAAGLLGVTEDVVSELSWRGYVDAWGYWGWPGRGVELADVGQRLTSLTADLTEAKKHMASEYERARGAEQKLREAHRGAEQKLREAHREALRLHLAIMNNVMDKGDFDNRKRHTPYALPDGWKWEIPEGGSQVSIIAPDGTMVVTEPNLSVHGALAPNGFYATRHVLSNDGARELALRALRSVLPEVYENRPAETGTFEEWPSE